MVKTQNNSNFLAVYFIAIGAFSLGMSSYITAGLLPLIQHDFANFISALATHFSILFISRLFAGIGAGVYLAIGIAIATTVVNPQQRGQAISMIMGGMAAGTVLGVPIGLLISNQLGWQASMYMISVLGGLAFIGLYFKLPQVQGFKVQSLSEKLRLLQDRSVLKILFISLLAAVSSLGFYTYLFPFLNSADFGAVQNITPFLWFWGVGGILGSILVGYVAKRVSNKRLTSWIMLILSIVFLLIPFLAKWNPWLTLVPIVLWGAVGWALQVPQNEQLIIEREQKGGGELAVALNESALYLGGAIGAGMGGLIFYFNWPLWYLPVFASFIVFLGFIYQMKGN